MALFYCRAPDSRAIHQRRYPGCRERNKVGKAHLTLLRPVEDGVETAADCEINASLPRLIGTGKSWHSDLAREPVNPDCLVQAAHVMAQGAGAEIFVLRCRGERIMQVLQPFSPSSSRRARLGWHWYIKPQGRV